MLIFRVCTSQVSWVQFLATASLFTFLYVCLKTFKFILGMSIFVYRRFVYNQWHYKSNSPSSC